MRRRRTSCDGEESVDPATSTPSKRQRVSIACDPCRVAKAKCDGDRPRCGTCLLQSKTCTYTHATRKRGVPTGYLRSMEVAMGWLFEHYPGSEDALHRQLSQKDDEGGTRMLMTKSDAGSRFHRRWRKSSVHRDIGRIVSGERLAQEDETSDGLGAQESTSSTNISSLELLQLNLPPEAAILPQAGPSTQPDHSINEVISPPYRRLTLPSNWKHLVEVYFAYTDCWLPIIERDSVIKIASAYLDEGIDVESHNTDSMHVQLWSVLAVASFQDAASSVTQPGSHSPDQIYSIACDLGVREKEQLDAPYISSILLQSLVQIGKREEIQAWVLIGKASRLALSSLSSPKPYNLTLQEDEDSSKRLNLILVGSLILDTLVSTYLGHSSVVASAGFVLPSEIFAPPVEPNESWVPILSPEKHVEHNHIPKSATLKQLHTFCQLWLKVAGSQKPTAEDLLKSIDPQFSFCNSLIFGGSIPEVPSAFLIQAILLTVTLCLAPTPRPALFLNLLELVELCIEKLGACGASPLTIILMEIIRKSGSYDCIHGDKNTRWMSALDSLEFVWRPTGLSNLSARNRIMESQAHFNYGAHSIFAHDIGVMVASCNEPSALNRNGQGRSTFLNEARLPPMSSNPQHDSNNNTELQSLGRNAQAQAVLNHAIGSDTNASPVIEIPQHADYDAILDELGSISYADTLDTNSRFMANLGFAPGYDLGEMFLSDFNT